MAERLDAKPSISQWHLILRFFPFGRVSFVACTEFRWNTPQHFVVFSIGYGYFTYYTNASPSSAFVPLSLATALNIKRSLAAKTSPNPFHLPLATQICFSYFLTASEAVRPK